VPDRAPRTICGGQRGKRVEANNQHHLQQPCALEPQFE